MEDGELARLLGEAVLRGHQLELCTAQVLARALSVSESTARLLASKLGQAAIHQIMEELVARRECGSLDPTELKSWISQAQVANRARNRIVHSPWVTDSDTSTFSVLINGSMKLEERSETELRHDIEHLTRAVASAVNLLRDC